MAHLAYPDSLFSRYANIIRIEGWNETVAAGHLALYQSLMHGESPLSPAERQAIAVVVSKANGCHY